MWGRRIRLSLFGESHGPAIGVVLDGLPPGLLLDQIQIEQDMERRAPGRSATATARREHDVFEILSGIFDGVTTGAPLAAIIRNENTRSSDYSPNLLRPGHADFTAFLRYKGFSDYRGGGHFSGRLTAPLVFAGAVAKQLLAKCGVSVKARIIQIGGVTDAELWHQAILDAKKDGDSLGGIIECVAVGVPGGWGEPFFESVESVISSLLFSVPAVKGVEFGTGFALAGMKGSEANDPLCYSGPDIITKTNHNGGINGGITNGMPVICRVAVKPTPSIGKAQRTVDTAAGKDVTVTFGGRHDPCIVPRAVVIVEAAVAMGLLDIGAPEVFLPGPKQGDCK